MKYPRVVVVVLGLLAACASSRPSGEGIDAAGDQTDAADTTGDGNDTTDAPDTIDAVGTTIDSSTIDSPMAIDAAPTDGVMPIDAPIDANTCPTSPCDIYAQCGCTTPLVCDLDFTDLVGNSCRAVNMNGTETSTCFSGSPATAQPSYCAGGYVCLGAGNAAHCEHWCDATSDCASPRGQCVIQVTNGATVLGSVCSSNCNPVNSAAGPCPSNATKCGFFTVNNALTGNTDRDIVDCTAAGTGTHGTTCTNDSTCAADTLCSTYNAASKCRRVCNRTTGGNECATLAGTTCIGFNPALTIGGTEYGVCAP